MNGRMVFDDDALGVTLSNFSDEHLEYDSGVNDYTNSADFIRQHRWGTGHRRGLLLGNLFPVAGRRRHYDKPGQRWTIDFTALTTTFLFSSGNDTLPQFQRRGFDRPTM